MKAYPLIYTRTKNRDFCEPFLYYPYDLDTAKSSSYINNVQNDAEFVELYRTAVFCDEMYCFYGICGVSEKILSFLCNNDEKFKNEHSDDHQYCKDFRGRNTKFFVGVAVPKTEMKKDFIPDIKLKDFWNIYIRFLKEQWDKEENEVTTMKVGTPVIDIDEKKYVSDFEPLVEKVGTLTAVKNYAGNEQKMIDYFLDQIVKGNNVSFITDVATKQLCQNLKFTHAVIPDSVIQALKNDTLSRSKEIKTSNSINKQTSSLPEIIHVESSRDKHIKEDQERKMQQEMQKKKDSHPNLPSDSLPESTMKIIPIIFLIVIIIIVIILLL